MDKLYKSGLTFEEFLSTGNEEDRNSTLKFLKSTEISKGLEDKVMSINRGVNVLVLGEIWCPDCMINIPAMEIINNLNPKLDFRIIPREGNEDRFDDYKVDGSLKIPTFIIMDENYRELGHILERPKKFKDFYDGGDQVAIIKNSKLYREGYFITDMIEEILSYIN